MTTTKPFQTTDQDDPIGLTIVNRAVLPEAENDMNTTGTATRQKLDLGNTKEPATGIGPHSRRPPKTKKSQNWSKTGNGGDLRHDLKGQGWHDRTKDSE